MWLLDVNVPANIVTFLSGRGIASACTDRQGWTHLKNSELVEAAVQQLFTDSGQVVWGISGPLVETPSSVCRRAPVSPAKALEYLAAFEKHWEKNPIEPDPGKMIVWP